MTIKTLKGWNCFVYLTISICMLCSSCCSRNADNSNNTRKEEVRISIEMIEGLPGWMETQRMTSEDIEAYLKVAKLVDERNFNDLLEICRKGDSTKDLEFDMRLNLLSKFIFLLPDPDPNRFDSYGTSWPVRYQDGQPVSIEKFPGHEGSRSSMFQYYDYLRGNFKFRFVAAIKDTRISFVNVKCPCSARFLPLDFPGDFPAFFPLTSELVAGHATRS